MRIWPTKRAWQRIAIGVAIVVAIALILNGVLAWRAEWRLKNRLARIRAAGDPASIAELSPEPIPDHKNAAITLQQITPRLDGFSKEYAQFSLLPIGKAYDEANDRGEPATPEQLDAIRAILDKYADVEQLLAAAAQQQEYASQMDFSLGHQAFLDALIESQGPPRTAARFLNWRIEVLLAEGQREDAIKRGIQVLRLARLYESEPTMVAFLVAIAMRGMAIQQMYDALNAGPISSELHAELETELTRLDDPQTLVRVLKMERAISADWVYAHLGGWYGALAHVVGWPMKSFQVGVLDMMEEYIKLAERPWHEVRGQFGRVNTPLPPTGHGVMADLLLPAVKAVFQANARNTAVTRALQVHNAMREFAEKHGREATGLDELNLHKPATIDPYSGRPLKLKRSDGGWVIYSVMENGVDDGGDFKGLKDYGVAPPKLRLTE